MEQICAKCGDQGDEVLLLACDHNLCLYCASKNLKREKAKGIQKKDTVVCDICSTPTKIENQAAQELLQISTSQSIIQSTNQSFQQTPSKQKVLNTESNGISLKCMEHPDEQVSYFCLDCECPCICSECVIHGEHKGHEVAYIKKAAEAIRSRIQEVQHEVETRYQDLMTKEAQVSLKQDEIQDQSLKIKAQMQENFHEFRVKLEQKEKDIYKHIDNFQNQVLEEIDQGSQKVNDKISSLQQLCELIREKIEETNDNLLISFYAQSREEIYNQMNYEKESNEVLNLMNMKCYLSSESEQKMEQVVNELHLNVATLRGVEDMQSARHLGKHFVLPQNLN